MDRLRRRPPMEGYTRPGSGGGEAWDDSVEGHTMDPRDDQDYEDTEGHGTRPKLGATPEDEDTEGHGTRPKLGATPEDEDTEGHGTRPKLGATPEDDDTEGHSIRNLTR
jgi:hypothetical protein